MSNLGDYIAPLRYRTLTPRGGGSNPQQFGVAPAGPLATPIIDGAEQEKPPECGLIRDPLTGLQALCAHAAYQSRMFEQMSRSILEMEEVLKSWRLRQFVPPEEVLAFLKSGGPVSLAAGSTAGSMLGTIASYSVPEGYEGFLTGFGVQVEPPGGYTDIKWQIRVSGSIHPSLNENFLVSTLATPMAFHLKLFPGRRLELTAANSGASALTVSGLLVGWLKATEPGQNRPFASFIS